ncbi:MAG: D-glycero-beta-D-manno-heptose 1-phosphate adenylyltransferase [Bacteroidetes bacterium HGW-Bacteroidetes-1]|jgi:rfaE bifunctional protein nucleotidyltransferase chain/domain|nr:MAG: D-glycero-beta-D-manno-heptose 1-phosphate adenylyltransferase [Bacteroidetes bacterium HGW-Bacteroidetes-1]
MKNLEVIQKRIYNWESIDQMLSICRFQHKKIVFTNGCFDILHLGHVDYLSKAADLGDILIVGVNTDASVRRLKGTERPLNDEMARTILIASLHFVDAVILFDQPTPYEIIQLVQPDVLVKGKDYKADEIVGYDIVTKKGGSVETIELVEGYSTSGLINKILRSS